MNKELLDQLKLVKDYLDGFQTEIQRGNNILEFCFILGQWKSSLQKAIFELEQKLKEKEND